MYNTNTLLVQSRGDCDSVPAHTRLGAAPSWHSPSHSPQTHRRRRSRIEWVAVCPDTEMSENLPIASTSAMRMGIQSGDGGEPPQPHPQNPSTVQWTIKERDATQNLPYTTLKHSFSLTQRSVCIYTLCRGHPHEETVITDSNLIHTYVHQHSVTDDFYSQKSHPCVVCRTPE